MPAAQLNRRVLLGLLFTCLFTACVSNPPGEGVIGTLGGDNKPLSLAVEQALNQSPRTQNLFIVVTSEDDVVRLKGTVNSETDYRAAEEVAGTVKGVRFVRNTLFIR